MCDVAAMVLVKLVIESGATVFLGVAFAAFESV